MRTHTHRTLALGVLFAALPADVAGQGRIARPPAPPGPIAVTLPSPSPGAMGRDRWPGRVDHPRRLPGPDHRLQRFGWSLPLLVTSTYDATPPAPAPYPVPYYYPVPVAVAPREPEKPVPPPPPYDPTKSRSLIIGAGADGGGGVMRITRPAPDSLQLTWLGTPRPIRLATLFVANEAQQPIRQRDIDNDRREAVFGIASATDQVAYAGLTVVFADGSTRTTLVPLARQ